MWPRALAAILFAALAAGCSSEAKKSAFLKRADSYFASGDYEKAKIEYLNALRLDARNPRALRQLGTIWFEQGALLNAAPFLLKSRELAPDDLDARTRLALVFMAAGQFAEARKEAASILDRSPDRDEALLAFVEASRSQQELDEAEQRIKSLGAEDKAGAHLARAALYLRRGDVSSAQKEASLALSLDPNSVPAHLALGKIYWLNKHLAEADQEFKAAADSSPARSSARLNYAEFKARSGATDVAKARLKDITREAPDCLPAWRLLAQIAFSEGKLDESLKFLENITLRDPANVEAHFLRGQILMAQGEVEKALEDLERLSASVPKFPPIKYLLARAYLQDQNPAQAAAALNQAIALDPDYADAILLLGEIDLQRGNAQQVVASMTGLLKKRPDLVPAQLLLAQAYQKLGRLDDAVALFREQTRISPQNAQYQLLLGMALQQKNQIDGARKAFEAARQLAPESLAPVAELVSLDIETKAFDSALQRVQGELQKTPNSAPAYFLEGKVYAAQGKWDRAEASLLKSLDLNPNSLSATDLLITTYLKSNKLSQAATALERLLSRNPQNHNAWLALATTLERMKDFSRAADAYEKALAIKTDAFALNNLAYLYAERLDQPDKAYELAQKAKLLRPEDPGIADTLGWVLYKKGDYAQSRALLQESAKMLPDNPEAQFHLAMASYMTGDMDAAAAAFRNAASSPIDFDGKDEVHGRLELLEGKGAELSSGELEAILARQPNDVVTRVRLGEAYEKQGAFDKAAEAYEYGVKQNPKLLPALTRLAELNSGPLRAQDKALEFAKKARELAPNDPKILSLLGRAAYRTGNASWAYSLLQESARQLPNDPEVLNDLAWAAYSLGREREARQTMQRVLSANPDATRLNDAKLFLAMTALDPAGGRLVATDSEVEKVLKTNPDYAPALLARADILRRRGEAKAAAEAYAEVLRRMPDFAPAQKRLASLYLEIPEKRNEAYALAIRARRALPEDAELAQILAELSYERNEFAYAVQLLKQSAEKSPLDAKSLYYLGMSHLKTKDRVQSRQALDRALAEGLQGPLASEARNALEELKRE